MTMGDMSKGQALVDAVASACQSLLDGFGAHRVSVWVHDEAAASVTPLVSVGRDLPTAELARRWSRFPVAGLGLLAGVLSDRTTMRVVDAGAIDIPSEMRADFGLTSLWAGPLVAWGQTLGLLVVEPLDVTDSVAMERHAVPVTHALSEARAWYLADRRKAELDLLFELTRVSVEADTGRGAIEHLCRQLARQLGVRRACVFFERDGRLAATHAYNADGSLDGDGYRAFAAAPPPPIVEEAFRSWTTKVVDEPANDLLDDWWAERFGIGSGIAVPIGTKEEPLGVLTLDDPQHRRFGERAVSLAEAAAGHFALLYERARFLDEHARGLRSGAAVRRLLREGSRARSIADAVEVVARVGREALEAEHAVAFTFDDGVIDEVLTVGIDEPWSALVRERCYGLAIGELPLGRAVIDRREPVVVSEAAKSDMLPAEMFDGIPTRSYVAIPLTAGTRLRGGVLYTTSSHTRRWSRADRHLVEQLMLECDLILGNADMRETEVARTRDLAHLALHDVLTGLPNRSLLDDRLAGFLRATARSGQQVGVLFIDLDGFKAVNDRLGHEVGDLVLTELASRLTSTVRPGDTVGRLAGDEFLVLLPEATMGEAETVARRLCEVARQPITVAGHTVSVGASIGIALGDHREEMQALVRRADTAMYRAKRLADHGYAVAAASPAPAGADSG